MKIFTVSLEILLVIFSVIFVCSCVLIVGRLFSRLRLSKNIGVSSTSSSDFNSSLIAVLLRNGVRFLVVPSQFVIKKIGFVADSFEFIVKRLSSKSIVATKVSVCSVIILALAILAILIGLIFQSVIAGLTVTAFVFLCFCVAVKAAQDKETEALREAVPDALNTMLACFQSGYSINQTFEHLQNEGNEQVKMLFKSVSEVFATGGTVTEALNSIKDNKNVPELSFVALALDVQHQTGGSIKPVLESAKEMIESKLELMAHLKVQTAQAKLSARVVTLLPFGLVAVFSIISPDFLKPFFSSVLGVFVFAVACLMQAAGVILVRKMLKVEI